MLAADSISCRLLAAEESENGVNRVTKLGMFRIRGRVLDNIAWLGTDVLDDLVDNVRLGKWSCLVLGAQETWHSIERFLLVVQWEEHGETAQRVGLLHTFTKRVDDAELGPFEEDLEMRRVRLI